MTQHRHPLSISDVKMYKFNTPQKYENIYQICTKYEVHDYQCVNKHYAQFEYKGMKTFKLQITQSRHHLSIKDRTNV